MVLLARNMLGLGRVTRTMNTSKLLLPIGATAFIAVSAHAAPFAFATSYTQQLMRIDMNSSATVVLGTIGFAAQGLAATSSGQLYATNNAGNLFNVTGGIATPVAALGALDVGAMDSTGSTLWGYDNNSQRLFEYDPIALNFVQWSTPTGIGNVKAMAIDSSGDFLIIANAGAVDKFGKIQNGTWSTTLINPNMALPDHCEAIDFLSDGNLYAAVLQDYRYQIDPLTGNAIGGFWSGTHRDWADMTTVPVPEPATFAVIAGGIGLVALRRRRVSK